MSARKVNWKFFSKNLTLAVDLIVSMKIAAHMHTNVYNKKNESIYEKIFSNLLWFRSIGEYIHYYILYSRRWAPRGGVKIRKLVSRVQLRLSIEFDSHCVPLTVGLVLHSCYAWKITIYPITTRNMMSMILPLLILY